MTDSPAQFIKQQAFALGFDLVGIAPAVSPEGFHPFLDWLEQGRAGEMGYLARRKEAYQHPSGVLQSVRSVIMLACNYRTQEPLPTGANQGRISRYAWGNADYHDILREKLRKLGDGLHQQFSGCKTRGVVDTAPLLERDFARLAGLGWFGKNTMILNKQQGSWFFLAALLTDAELPPDQPHDTSHCGTCTRCLDACPTNAFPEPHVLDARRCISYLTIELRSSIPQELREPMGHWVFGCDVCQDVCPWNRKAPLSREPLFAPTENANPLDLIELLSLTEEEFRARFRHSPMLRPGRAGLLRNAAIVLGNIGNSDAIPALISALNDQEPLIRGAAAWALGKLGGEQAGAALQSRLNLEDNAEVQQELRDAVNQ